jgi:integrase/recombinase XerD
VKEVWTLDESMFLTEAEASRLLGELRGRDDGSPAAVTDRLIVEGLLFSGLRNSEFCELTVGRTAVGLGRSAFQVVSGRGEERMVEVPAFVSDLVRRYCEDVRPEMLREEFNPKDRSLPLLVNERGRPYERTGLYRRVLRVLSECGFGSRASVQLLRHTYGYLAYKLTGGNLLFVQQQLGHAHPMVTAIYANFVSFPAEDLAASTAAPFVPGPRPRGRPRSNRASS